MDTYEMNVASASQTAIAAVESMTKRNDNVCLGNRIYVGIDGDDTLWVSNNGTEVIGLNQEQAIDALVEHLMALN